MTNDPGLSVLRLGEVVEKIAAVTREFEIKCRKRDPDCHEFNFMGRIEGVLKERVWSRFRIEPSYEYRVSVGDGFIAKHYGRIDAYYGLVFFEYKTPVPGISDDGVRRDAIEKAMTVYIPGLLEDEGAKRQIEMIRRRGFKPLIVGVILDGRRVVFVEYDADSSTYRIDPQTGYYELTPNTLRRIIRLVLATYRKRLDATILASEFGYRSGVAKKLVSTLYKKLENIEKTGGRPLHLFEEWKKAISTAYPIGRELSKIAEDYGITGVGVDGAKLFFAIQTYYALILKILGAEVASRFYDASLTSFMDHLKKKTASDKELLQELKIFELGGPPSWYGVKNLLEGQLFSWYLDVWDSELHEAVKELIEKLSEFDVESLELDPRLARDLFKLLYEELVPREEVRKHLGIYTTPDWLAELVLDKLGLTVDRMVEMAEKKGDPLAPLDIRVLDPGVGTGTFLTLYIQRLGEYLRTKFGNSIPEEKAREALRKITKNVVGFDIDALALMTARVNYLIALAGIGLLPYKGGESIEIPVYMANSIAPAELSVVLDERGGSRVYRIKTSVGTFTLPTSVTPKLDRILEIIEEGLEKDIECPKEKLDKELTPEETRIVCEDFYGKLLNLKREGRDTIWISIVKSYLLPIQQEKSFDYVIGNPPWLPYRHLSDPDYQEGIIKPLIKDKYGLTTKPELISNMEMATLFFVRSVDKFLKDGGRIGFVMPKSIYSSDHHDRFRRGQVSGVRFCIDLVVDVEKVKPLFYVPACSIIATKSSSTIYPINAEIVEGKLPAHKHKVLPLSETKSILSVESEKLYLNKVGERSFWHYGELTIRGGRSYYYDKFRAGASIIPRSYWFVDVIEKIVDDKGDINIVVVMTSRRAKREEAKVTQEIGPRPVEHDYLYGVLTSSELIPFYHLKPAIAVLPIKPAGNTYQLLRRDILEKSGYKHMASWLCIVEKMWEEHRGAKTVRADIYEWLDYQRKLTLHNPGAKYRVVYNASGTHLVASVIEVGQLEIAGVRLNDIIADAKLIVAHIDNGDEAHYLASVLNSTEIDKLIKPMQSRGILGERDIMKKPLELPIPRYDPDNLIHRRLAELGARCSDKVRSSLDRVLRETGYDEILEENGVLSPNQVGVLRRKIRSLLSEELEEIDALTRELLRGATGENQGLLRYLSHLAP